MSCLSRGQWAPPTALLRAICLAQASQIPPWPQLSSTMSPGPSRQTEQIGIELPSDDSPSWKIKGVLCSNCTSPTSQSMNDTLRSSEG